MSFIHNNSYNSLKNLVVQTQLTTEPRLFSVAINFLGTDADEQRLYPNLEKLQALPQKNSLAQQPSQTPAFTIQNPGYGGELHPIIVT